MTLDEAKALHQNGRLDEARTAYQLVLEQAPDTIDAYYNLGLIEIKCHQYQRAQVIFDALLSLVPHHIGGLFQRGRLLMQEGNDEQASHYFLEIERMNPNHLETIINLATCYLKMGKRWEAKSRYHRALELGGEDVQIYYNLGVLNTQMGRLKEASESYQRALRLQPDLFEAHYNLGILYHKRQEREATLIHLRHAKRLQPENRALNHLLLIVAGEQPLTSPPEEYIHDLFESYADHYDHHMNKVLEYRVPERMRDVLQQQGIQPVSAWRVLDLGCGTGLCGAVIRPYAQEMTGVDLSSKMLAIAREKGIYDKLEVAHLTEYVGLHADVFHLVVAADVFVYLSELRDPLSAIFAALRPGGYLLFNTEGVSDEPMVRGEHGRFSHGAAYVRTMLRERSWREVACETATLRLQNDSPCEGKIWLCQKQEDR